MHVTPFLALVIAGYALFIGVLGGVSLVTNLPTKKS
jgi:hypothetical protein